MYVPDEPSFPRIINGEENLALLVHAARKPGHVHVRMVHHCTDTTWSSLLEVTSPLWHYILPINVVLATNLTYWENQKAVHVHNNKESWKLWKCLQDGCPIWAWSTWLKDVRANCTIKFCYFLLFVQRCDGFKCLLKTLVKFGIIYVTDPLLQNTTKIVCLHWLTFDIFNYKPL